MKVILYQPQIPQNTGNIVRSCSVTNTELLLVEPLGFSIGDRWLKRAGLDYWAGVSVDTTHDLEGFLASYPHNFHFFSSHAKKSYAEASFAAGDALIFGSETTGLPQSFRERWPDKFLTIPMTPSSRCLNLSTSVGIALYEAWRQNDFSWGYGSCPGP